MSTFIMNIVMVKTLINQKRTKEKIKPLNKDFERIFNQNKKIKYSSESVEKTLDNLTFLTSTIVY